MILDKFEWKIKMNENEKKRAITCTLNYTVN